MRQHRPHLHFHKPGEPSSKGNRVLRSNHVKVLGRSHNDLSRPLRLGQDGLCLTSVALFAPKSATREGVKHFTLKMDVRKTYVLRGRHMRLVS